MSAQRRKSAEVSCMHMIIQNPVSGRRQATRVTMRCTRRIKWRRIRLPVQRAAMPDLHAAASRPQIYMTRLIWPTVAFSMQRAGRGGAAAAGWGRRVGGTPACRRLAL